MLAGNENVDDDDEDDDEEGIKAEDGVAGDDDGMFW